MRLLALLLAACGPVGTNPWTPCAVLEPPGDHGGFTCSGGRDFVYCLDPAKPGILETDRGEVLCVEGCTPVRHLVCAGVDVGRVASP